MSYDEQHGGAGFVVFEGGHANLPRPFSQPRLHASLRQLNLSSIIQWELYPMASIAMHAHAFVRLERLDLSCAPPPPARACAPRRAARRAAPRAAP